MYGLRFHRKSLVTTAIAVGLVCAGSWRAEADAYVQTDLVSNVPGLATITDPELVNPWGFSHSATSPFWVSNQGTKTTTLYAVTNGTNVTKTSINPPSGFVLIPPPATGGPTGQVSNNNGSSFDVGNGGNGATAHFIFGNLNGTISAWDTGTTAFVQVTSPGASYTGLATNQAQTLLYAANDAGTGSINVFNSSFAPVSVAGTFTDPNLPAGYVPFNVQDIGGKVYVTYAPAGRASQVAAAPGQGYVAIFDESGNFLQSLLNSDLAAPWGIALAPDGFGPFGGDLLVGNFSFADSEINAFDPLTGTFEGTIPIDVGSGNTSGGLWDIGFGTGGSNGSPDVLYFTDGINGETDGLFGAISVPEPATIALFGAGTILVRFCANRRRRKKNAA
jgi:uncharacterized protein (TIGR03118 family)